MNWQRFKKYFHHNADLGVSLDISDAVVMSRKDVSSRRSAVGACVALGALAISTARAAPVDLGAALEPIRARHNVAGIVALVLRGDDVIAQGAAGVRKRGAPEPITAANQLHLGSCTKAMTATLAAMLVDEGKLAWTTTLEELFGRTVGDLDPVWRPVTVRQVLIHRAGFHRGGDREFGMPGAADAAGATVLEMRRRLVRYHLTRPPPEAPPGEKEIYSNVGYVVIAAAIEQITGRSWEQLMRERIFRPLDIASGGFGAPGTAGSVAQPWGHSRNGEPADPGNATSDMLSFAGPCGNVHMTISDWARFVSIHLRGSLANPRREASLLTRETFAEMHRADNGDTFGLGWGLGTIEFARGPRPTDSGRALGHQGNNGFWFSNALLAPELDLAVLVVCNQGGASVGGKVVAEASAELMKDFAKRTAAR